MFFNCRNRAFSAGCHLGGGGALYSHLNDASRNETASSQKFSQTTPQNANNAQNGLINPQDNDPVVFTTDYGLEIKYANALTYLTGYTYFTAGGVNWVIIGYDPSVSVYVGDFTDEFQQNAGPIQGGYFQSSTIDSTPAGNAIAREMYAISSLAKPNDEIGDWCVLCLAEKPVDPDGVQFNTSTSVGNNYKGSNLEKYIDETIYGGTSELSLALQALPIAPQKLTTLYYGSATSTIENAHLFPLAGRDNTESFYVDLYLNSNEKRDIDINFWLRSGYESNSGIAHSVGTNGYIYIPDVTQSYGVRPAFVLKI